MNTVPHTAAPVFSAPARWALRVLAWLAFGVSAYLAWHAINQTPVAGCGVGSDNGCDAVLSSPWSKWLGIPVAVAGLACYATLAGLSVLLSVQDSRASRWITTAFLMLAVLAAGASLWFIAVQVLAIGDFCLFCIITDVTGIAIGAVAIWFAARWWRATGNVRRSSNSATGLMSLRSALPTGARTAPVVAQRNAPTPLMPIALGGAVALLGLLIGGQIVFPGKPYDVQEVALNESIELMGANNGDASDTPPSADAETRVAMRVPAEPDGDEAEPEGEAPSKPATVLDNGSAGASPSPSASATSPGRKAKFLGGKLTLDVYKHPLIGSPEAPHVLVELVSYDCRHCRKTHGTMKQALSRYGKQVAVIVLVIPLEKGCNKLVTNSAGSHAGACTTARMALGVAKLKPASFPRYHDWLMSGGDKPPGLDTIIAKAYSVADRTRLRELRESDELDKQIAQYVDLFDMLRKQNAGNKEFGLPIQILGDHVMSGTVEKADDLHKAWEKHLGVKRL